MKKNFQKICVLKGGFSTEREISLLSGSGMANAARSLGYEVSEFDFTGDIYALLAFLTYLVAYLGNKKYIVLSNESSANESNVR